MASYSNLQNLQVKSTTNAPASIGGAVTATTVGTLLLNFVTATSSGTPTITSPGGAWLTAYNTSVLGLAYACFYQLSNVGGINNVTSTLGTTTAGGATWAFMEQAMSTPVLPTYGFGLDFQTSYNQSTTGVPWSGITNLPQINELIFYCLHYQAATYTANNTFEWVNFNSLVSTGSTTNAQHNVYACTTAEQLSQPTGGGNLNSAVKSGLGYIRFTSNGSFSPDFSTVPNSGTSGYINPNKYQGMIGG